MLTGGKKRKKKGGEESNVAPGVHNKGSVACGADLDFFADVGILISTTCIVK